MAIEIPVIRLGRDEGRPTVEVIFGHAHLGNYRFFLWDPDGKNPQQIAHGNNIDDVVDVFEIGRDPSPLDGCLLSDEAIVQAVETKPGQIYSLTITVRQHAQVCDGGLIQETGIFEDVKAIIGFRRFRVNP